MSSVSRILPRGWSLYDDIIVRSAMILAALAVMMFPVVSRAETERTPLIIVPGIQGSKLCDGDEVIWGDLGSLRDLRRLELGTLQGERIKPCGLIDKIKIIGPLAIDVYFPFLDKLTKTLGYRKNQTYFEFPYDWRRSNYDTARELNKFVKKVSAAHSSGKVDIVAHSMGGLITSIMLRQGSERASVRHVFFVGVPFYGAPAAVNTLKVGWGEEWIATIGGVDVMRRTIASFPSWYELLPRYERCCRWKSSGAGESVLGQPFELLDPANWDRLGWLPAEYRSGEKKGFVLRSLAAARNLVNLIPDLNRPRPQTWFYVNALKATSLGFDIDPVQPDLARIRFSPSPMRPYGDGTVPLYSAAALQPVASLDFSHTLNLVNDHAYLLSDERLIGDIRSRLILEKNPPVGEVKATARTNEGEFSIDGYDLVVQPGSVPPGGSVTIDLRLWLDTRIVSGYPDTIDGIAAIIADGNRSPLHQTGAVEEANGIRLDFAGEAVAPPEPGTYDLAVSVPGGFTARHILWVE
jgi:pimeloyl-ACP methyl ester carboxylesterase